MATEGSGAGWYGDPTGRSELRYWNGSVWTDDVARGQEQSTDKIEGDYAPPSSPAPRGVAPKKAKKKWPWVLGGIVVAMILLCGGCTALFVVSVDKAVTDLNAEQERHAITPAQFDAVAIGTSQADVIASLGKEPEDTQEFVSEGVLDESEVSSSCIYYNKAGGEFGDLYQFCFDEGGLRSKNAY